MKKVILTFLMVVIASSVFLMSQGNTTAIKSNPVVHPNTWEPLQTIDENGLLGERVDLWRNNRLWFIAEDGYLIDGFENRPGVHAWQGEHIGKWLHAATLAYNVTGDEKLKEKLDEMVERLMATQLPDGYMGTYTSDYTFMAQPASNRRPGGWDTWTFRYNIYGLLTYEKYFPNQEIVEACKKMADLLISIYGEGKHDLTKYGTRQGISATTLLESIVMLYERTVDEKYLDFAEHIVEMSENNPGLRLMGTMLEEGSVVYPGDGKAYQLMANLFGYLRLYRITGNEKYLQTVLHGWHEIHTKHLLTTGGPWSRKMPYNGNKECFAHSSDAFHPEEIVVEGCSDASWIQLNIHLFEFTGDAKYFNEAEVTLINSVYGHQHSDGIRWCYYTAPNQSSRPYTNNFHCCASSEPRGMEMYSSHLAGKINMNLSINTLFPSTIKLTDQFGGGEIKIEGSFPFESSAKIYLETVHDKQFTLEFRIPVNSSLASVTVNGEKTEATKNERGFFELNRKWGKGDVIAVDLDYELKAHLQDGEKGGKWVAFTYGPIALAQKITEMTENEPFTNLGPKEPSEYLEMLSRTSDSEIEFTIEGTNISLIPYYQTGSLQTGPKTYFNYYKPLLQDFEVVDVTNPSTGKIWMDRNLGASRVATSSDDDEAYGDLYQWGRDADGHQKLTSGTTEDLSDSDTPGHGDFIFAPGNNPGDWRSTLNNDLWQGVNGVNNPCPQGYRLPTQAELDEERESWGSNDLAGAFASPLKLPAAGRRMWNTGNIARSGLTGYYWSSTVNDHRIRNLDFSDSSANSNALNLRANGLSVRCIKEVVDDTGINTPDINKIKVYPVPASNQLTVSGLSGTASELQIVNVTGQTVKTIISSGAETPIDITDLQPGYYFIRAENRTLKFIKQ